MVESDPPTTAGKLADLARRAEGAVRAGPTRSIEKQHARGKKTARERIEMLVDPGSFVELDGLARHRSTNFGPAATRPYGDGVVTGYGTVDGRQSCVFAQDFTVFGGSLGEVFGEKIVKVVDLAMKIGCPVVGMNDSGGARIQEGVVSLGNAHYLASDVEDAIEYVKALLGYLPSNNLDEPPAWDTPAELEISATHRELGRRGRPAGRRAAGSADPGLRGHAGQPVHRRGTWVPRRGDRTLGDAAAPGSGPTRAAHQEGEPPAEEARQHSVVVRLRYAQTADSRIP